MLKSRTRIKVGNNSKSNLIVVEFNEKTYKKVVLQNFNSELRQEDEFKGIFINKGRTKAERAHDRTRLNEIGELERTDLVASYQMAQKGGVQACLMERYFTGESLLDSSEKYLQKKSWQQSRLLSPVCLHNCPALHDISSNFSTIFPHTTPTNLCVFPGKESRRGL